MEWAGRSKFWSHLRARLQIAGRIADVDIMAEQLTQGTGNFDAVQAPREATIASLSRSTGRPACDGRSDRGTRDRTAASPHRDRARRRGRGAARGGHPQTRG